MSSDSATHAQSFRTFCHISEYGEWGYANLHRMIASSDPLYLWAPSTQLLKSENCRISEKAFVKLVDAGKVRIVAREWWYTDPSRRDKHEWSGAHWNQRVDGHLAGFAKQDASEPLEDRRVLIARDETGERDAANLIAHNPGLVQELYDLLNSPEVDQHIPPGVRETVSRFPDEPETLATRILRDAYNHGDALEITAPRAPFMLGEKDGAFFSLLQRVLRDKAVPQAQVAQEGLRSETEAPLSPEDLKQLTDDVLRMLKGLERGRDLSLAHFLRGDGHSDLVKWLGQQCLSAATATNGYEAGGILRQLQSDLDDVVFYDSVQDVFANPGTLFAGSDLSISVADVAQASASTLGWLGLVIGVIPLGWKGLQTVGLVPVRHSGVHWPFLYSFGSASKIAGATPRRRGALGKALDSLSV